MCSDDTTTIGGSNGVLRVQAEGVVTIGDYDWAGYGTDTHIEVNDGKSQISMSAVGGVMVKQLAIGSSIDVEASAKGVLQKAASDYRLKENIEPIENALDKVLHLNGVNFEWKDKERRGYGKQIGMIAQDVKKYVPEVVFKKDEYYGMNYSPIVSLLVEAIKEQQPQIDELLERLDILEDK